MAKKTNLLCIEISSSLMENRKQISNYFSSPSANKRMSSGIHKYIFLYNGVYFEDVCHRVGGSWKKGCNSWIWLAINFSKKDMILIWEVGMSS